MRGVAVGDAEMAALRLEAVDQSSPAPSPKPTLIDWIGRPAGLGSVGSVERELEQSNYAGSCARRAVERHQRLQPDLPHRAATSTSGAAIQAVPSSLVAQCQAGAPG